MDQQTIQAIFSRQVDNVYRVCYSYLGNAADAEDAVQEVFLKMIRADRSFADPEHEKAWLIRVAINHCKDMLRAAARQNVPLDSVAEPAAPLEPAAPSPPGALGTPDVHGTASPLSRPNPPGAASNDTLDAVLRLDPRLKDVVLLYYYEGYSTDEIASILERPPSTVRNQLREARQILKQQLGGGSR